MSTYTHGHHESVTEPALARQLVDDGYATTDDLRRIRAGWLAWVAADDGWISILHGEILGRTASA